MSWDTFVLVVGVKVPDETPGFVTCCRFGSSLKKDHNNNNNKHARLRGHSEAISETMHTTVWAGALSFCLFTYLYCSRTCAAMNEAFSLARTPISRT